MIVLGNQDTIGVGLLLLVGALFYALAYWTYRDANARGSSQPLAWAAGVACLPAVFGPYYLLHRRGLDPRSPRTRTDRILGSMLVAVSSGFVLVASFAPPDPVSQLRTIAVLFPVLVALAYVLLYRVGADQLRNAA